MLKKLFLTTLFTFSLFLGGCRHSDHKTVHHSANPSIALVTNAPDDGTNPYIEAGKEGLKNYAQQHHLSTGKNGYQIFSPNYTKEDYSLIDQAAQKNFHTIIALGASFKNAVDDTASLYPHNNFVLIDGKAKSAANVTSITFNSWQMGYLAGVAAASSSKTHTVGILSQPASSLLKGYLAGINYYSKYYHVKTKILAKTISSAPNKEQAQNLTQQIYLKGADIIFSAVGQNSQGVFSAAKAINQTQPVNQKVWVIGVDNDQSSAGKYQAKGGQPSNFTLTSVIKNIPQAIENVSEESFNNAFPARQLLNYDLKNNGVTLIHSTNLSYSSWIAIQKARTYLIQKNAK
ncbi:BMP family ABC transporter substrate-binding protein [Lactobacillus sp. PV012]|uniref:BMP family ABC transporter substrate-binding protein n=1 Tax=Lactobacillus sp. PV012 TaxID=2594494 RepID=UPI00223FC3F0|nr:BMP family ABC transporter substrate-binding protein [Lactobacillus sp. PV012]QNQ81562.1 BMP family ABC transporter substrate-binding protein [Lactobacillus sp. PV012]